MIWCTRRCGGMAKCAVHVAFATAAEADAVRAAPAHSGTPITCSSISAEYMAPMLMYVRIPILGWQQVLPPRAQRSIWTHGTPHLLPATETGLRLPIGVPAPFQLLLGPSWSSAPRVQASVELNLRPDMPGFHDYCSCLALLTTMLLKFHFVWNVRCRER